MVIVLVALNSDNKRCLAFETEKNEKPFICPACSCSVILKKGKVREHHYAHEPDSNCEYGKGESQIHYKVKREIYSALKNHPNCSKCDVERVLKGVRPDVSLVINDCYVAIEIQKSDISIEEINRRFAAYSDLGIYLLWVLPIEEPKTFYNANGCDDVCRVRNWQRHLHNIHYERLYYWQSGATVKAYHMGTFYTYKDSTDWGGGYWEEKLTLKHPIPYDDDLLHLAEDFTPMERECCKREKGEFPNYSKILVDNKSAWWARYYEQLHHIVCGTDVSAKDYKSPSH